MEGCGAFRVGDEGQRYEVCVAMSDGRLQEIGYTNDPSGGSLAEGARLHPDWGRGEVRIRDRQAWRDVLAAYLEARERGEAVPNVERAIVEAIVELDGELSQLRFEVLG